MAYTPPQSAEQTAFLTTTPLGAGLTYDSGIVDLTGFSQVQTEVLASHDGTIDINFYADAGGTDIVRTLSIPYLTANGYQFFAAPAFANYARYEFTNDAGVIQTDFYYTTKITTVPISPQLLTTEAFIAPSMVTQLGRNIIVGQDTNGAFRNVPVNSRGNLQVDVVSPNTAFGDLRNAELTTQAAITFEYNINPDIVISTEANSGTVTQADAMAVLQTSTNAAGSAEMKSIRLLKYRAGLGALARFTGLFTTGVASSTQIIGVGNDENGFFFGYNGTSFGILHRTDSSDVWIPQTTWNEDVMDGSGLSDNPSGMTLDQTNLNVFEIQYQYLGAGQIEFFVEDEVNGRFVPVHKIQYANNNTTPSLYNPSLPLYAYVENSGNATNLTLKSSSMAAFVEGKNISTGIPHSFSNSKSTATELALFSVRSKTTYAGKTNGINSFMKQFSVANDSNGLATYVIREDTTLGGTPVWADVDVNASVMETDTAGTTVSGGKVLATVSVGKDSGEAFNLSDLEIIMKPSSTYTVSAFTAGASNVLGASLGWKEDF